MKTAEKTELIQTLRRVPPYRMNMTVIDDNSEASEKKAVLRRLERDFRTGGKRIRIVSTEA